MSAPESITQSGSEKVECSICASVIGEPRDDGTVESGIYLPCGHFFGMRCLAHNIMERQNCPICRADLPGDITTDLLRINRGLEGSATGDRLAEGGRSWRELDVAEAERDAAMITRPVRGDLFGEAGPAQVSPRRGYRSPEYGGSLSDQFRTRRQQRAESTVRGFEEFENNFRRAAIRPSDQSRESFERLQERVSLFPRSSSIHSSVNDDSQARGDARARYSPSSSSHPASDLYEQYSSRVIRPDLDRSPSPPFARHHSRSYRSAQPIVTSTARGTRIEEVTRDLGSLSVREREHIYDARRRAMRERSSAGADDAIDETLERALNDPDYFRRGVRYLNRRDPYGRGQ